jgi:hypothetical protein
MVSVQQAGVRWRHAATEARRGMKSRIHTACDGAEWIAGQTRATFGNDATLLIDSFHVSESLAGAAPTRALPKPPSAGGPSAGSGPAAHATEAAQKRSEPQGHRSAGRAPRSAGERGGALPRACGAPLPEPPAESLDHAAAIAAGLPIVSGLIESGHKHVLEARLKIPGASWLPTDAETMAQLRVLRSNQCWSELLPQAA